MIASTGLRLDTGLTLTRRAGGFLCTFGLNHTSVQEADINHTSPQDSGQLVSEGRRQRDLEGSWEMCVLLAQRFLTE